jgi:hypothetical protein
MDARLAQRGIVDGLPCCQCSRARADLKALPAGPDLHGLELCERQRSV